MCRRIGHGGMAVGKAGAVGTIGLLGTLFTCSRRTEEDRRERSQTHAEVTRVARLFVERPTAVGPYLLAMPRLAAQDAGRWDTFLRRLF